MLIFLDCEFTDFIDCELLSIGMVSEDGLHEFYAERTDYNDSWCNNFVREGVLPLLGRFPGAACTRDELTKRVWEWFATLPPHVQLASDSAHDCDLLWDAFGEGLPENLDKSVFDLRSLIDTTVFNDALCRYHEQPNQPWHHALHDAHAHRVGWLAWMDAENAPRAVPSGRRSTKPHYCLKDLLAQCDVNAPVSEEVKAWEGMGAVGNEILTDEKTTLSAEPNVLRKE